MYAFQTSSAISNSVSDPEINKLEWVAGCIYIYCTLRGRIKGTARSFFLHTESCARERAVFNFIQNSRCVEGSYRCCMAYLALVDTPIEC